MYCRCLTTSVTALLLAAGFAMPGSQARAANPPGKAVPAAAPQRMSLSKAMSRNIVVEVPVTVTLPADYEALYDEDNATNGTFWATKDDLRAAFQGDGVDTKKLKRGAFWFRHTLNVGYDAQTGKFIPEESDESLAKKAGATNFKRTQSTVNGRAICTITGQVGTRSFYMLYVWTGIDTNCILVSYHHPAGKHTPQDDEIWAQFVNGLGATGAGQSRGATKNSPASKLHQTPQEAFLAFMAAGEKEDWKAMCECLSDKTRDGFAAGLIFAGSLAQAFATTPEERVKFKRVEDVLTKYGVGPSKEPRKALKTKTDFDQAGTDIEKAMMMAVASIKDRNAFIAEMLAAFKQARPDTATNLLAGQFFDFKDVTLEELKIQGDSATAVVVARRDGQEARQPLNFQRVEGGWRIEIPESGNGDRR